MIVLPIAFATGTEAQAALAEGNYTAGQVGYTLDSRRIRIGLEGGTSHLLGWPVLEPTFAPSAVNGTTTASLTNGYGLHLAIITLTAGVGAYTLKRILPALEAGGIAVLNGTILDVKITWPASDRPTLEFYNEEATGTPLWKWRNVDAILSEVFVRFVRAGGEWVRWGHQIADVTPE